MSDLKAVYAAVDEQAALDALETFAQNWDNKHPKIAKSWRENWANLSTYFKYPQEVRRLIYTTNTIEGFNRQLRKVTKSKSVFPTDDSLLKMLYLAMMDPTSLFNSLFNSTRCFPCVVFRAKQPCAFVPVQIPPGSQWRHGCPQYVPAVPKERAEPDAYREPA